MIGALLLSVALAAPPGPVFTIHDPRIDENSGMVDLGALTVVTNDSGDVGRLFVLDGEGRTVGVTTYGPEGGDTGATDVEALAPGGGDRVWVGDIGDNDRVRDHVVVRLVTVGRGERRVTPPSYRLVYPDGAHDAETLLRDPTTGRLYVVTKSLLGGVVYAAPATLRSGTNRLTKLARVPVFATDGTFLADGAHVLVRGYTSMSLYAFPSFKELRTVALPSEPQGESLSVGPGGRVRIGTEGRDQPVLAVSLPASSGAGAPPSKVDDAARGSGEDDQVDSRSGDPVLWPVLWSVLGASLLAGAGLVGMRRSRRRR